MISSSNLLKFEIMKNQFRNYALTLLAIVMLVSYSQAQQYGKRKKELFRGTDLYKLLLS